jgi:DNA helicase-2/ATP-dependent DNA helicase PcrA
LITKKSKTIKDAISVLAAYTGQLKGKNKSGEMSLQFAEKIALFVNADCVASSVNALAHSFEGLQTDLGKAEDDVFYVDPPFLHLAEYATRYGADYGQFIDDIESAKEKLAYLPPATDPTESEPMNEEWRRPIHLMTAPRAKGKEFDTVILLDVNEGIWPNKNATTEAELEAERRVFYVAFTRVKERLLILVNEKIGQSKAEPSRYLREAGLV